MDGRLTIYGQEKLTPDAREAALAAAHAVLSREGISAREAVQAAGIDLLLAEGLEPEDRTDEHFREHGATLQALETHDAAKVAAAGAVARLDPANTGFAIMFSVVG